MPELKNKAKCPVCGMDVNTETGLKAEHKGQFYYFCNEDDKRNFMQSPEKYIGRERKVA